MEDKKIKKIAFLVRNFDITGGGAERFCVELVNGLKNNYEVHVFSQNITARIPKVEFHQVTQKINRPRFLNQFLFGIRARKILKNSDFDIIHSHDIIPGADVYTIHVPCFKSFITNSSSLKKVLLLLSLPLSPRKLMYLLMENKVYRPNKKILPVSNLLAQNIRKNYPKSAISNITYPGIWPENDKFTKNNKLRKDNLIPIESFVVLFMGHSFERKGLQSIIQALEILNNSEIYLLVAGNGKENDIKFSNEHVKKNTKFLGKIDQISDFYSAGNVMVHPTRGDTFGMVVLEAMQHSIPVIVSNKYYCGISETLNQDNSILISNPQDKVEISNAILTIFKDQELANTLGSNGKRHASTFTWNNTITKTLEAYNSN